MFVWRRDTSTECLFGGETLILCVLFGGEMQCVLLEVRQSVQTHLTRTLNTFLSNHAGTINDIHDPLLPLQECHPEWLFSESKFLKPESLVELVKVSS